jgi:hypothetical protein
MQKLAPLLLLTSLASPALAQDRDTVPVTEYEFVDPEHVRGEAPAPLETFTVVPRNHDHRSLIAPRWHFRPELVKSVEGI